MALDQPERTRGTRDAVSGAMGGAVAAAGGWALLFAGFLLLCLASYWPALTGPFVSDDIAYLVTQPYTGTLSPENLRAILDPWGPAKFYTANYEPVHLLLGAPERHIFADATLGYHLVGVFVHALVALLLVACLRRVGVWSAAALLGGLCFLVRPAKAEVVAWALQRKTSASLAFAPVTQLFPFVNPAADRYLYFILPGLIGGALLSAQAWMAPSQRPWIRSGRAPAAVVRAELSEARAHLAATGGPRHSRPTP